MLPTSFLLGQLEAGPGDQCDLPIPSHRRLCLGQAFHPKCPSPLGCLTAAKVLLQCTGPLPGIQPALASHAGEGCWGLPAGAGRRGQSILWGRCRPAAAAGWVARSSFLLQQSLLYCNHTIIMPLKCHIRRNPHKQGISSCQKIVVLLLMTCSPSQHHSFFLNINFSLFFFCF